MIDNSKPEEQQASGSQRPPTGQQSSKDKDLISQGDGLGDTRSDLISGLLGLPEVAVLPPKPKPPASHLPPSVAKQQVYIPITNKVMERKAHSDSLKMAIEMSHKIKQQTQNLIRDRIMNVQKQVQEQSAEQKRTTVNKEVVSVVEKQVQHQANLAKSFRDKISGIPTKPQLTMRQGQLTSLMADTLNNRQTSSTIMHEMAGGASKLSSKLSRPNQTLSVALQNVLPQSTTNKQRPTPQFKVQLEPTQSESINGRGVQQVPVADEEEPDHVPIAEIIKANHIEMQQQQAGFQRPPSSKIAKPPLFIKRTGDSPELPLPQFGQTLQESQQSGSGQNDAPPRAFPPEEPSPAIIEPSSDKEEEQDISKRVNVLKDVSINLNTDDQMDDDQNTIDKESVRDFTANELNASLDLKDEKIQIMNDDGPKMGRNMGFPNMKYLDPDAQGPPIQEKTLYKEYQKNKDNDIRLKREGYSNQQDMANNTFIKLFQASENPDKREELQSVQYAEQILDDETSNNEEGPLFAQKKFQQPSNLFNMHPPSSNGQIEQSANKAKSKSLGKIGDHHIQDQSMRIKTRRKNSNLSRPQILSPDKINTTVLNQQQPFTGQQTRQLSQQLPPLQHNVSQRPQLITDFHPSRGFSHHQSKQGESQLFSKDTSDQVIKSALPGFQPPQGMTQVPIMFSGSIPSLQYQDSTKGIIQFQTQQPNLSPAQAFLNQQLSRSGIDITSQEGPQGKQSGLLPPISNTSNSKSGPRFGQSPPQQWGEDLPAQHQRFQTVDLSDDQRQARQMRNPIQSLTNTIDTLTLDIENPMGMRSPEGGHTLIDSVMPPRDFIDQELMNKFGGHELSATQQQQQKPKPPFGAKIDSKRNAAELAILKLESKSCMTTKSPEVVARYSQKEDKAMREILDGYQGIMNSGLTSKENLYLKKLRFHHPIFRELSFNAFKMLFDLCEIVQIKKGQKLFKQDKQISDLYFVMHGRLALVYTGYQQPQEFKEGGYLGLTLGEELLFYKEPLYRETAVCTTTRCCALRIRADYILELGDESFVNLGLNSEAMKKDMDLLFTRLSHIYNKKERWRIFVAATEQEHVKQNESQYTQFIKSI